MIKILDSIDIDNVIAQFRLIEPQIIWNDANHKGKQTSIQHKDGEDIWISSVGRPRGIESDFCKLNPLYKDTIFEELVKKYNLVRSRFLWLGASACYSFHADPAPRVHIPIFTNNQSWFIFKNGKNEHLSVGYSYWVDTRLEHTAMNGHSDKPRLHMVGVVNA